MLVGKVPDPRRTVAEDDPAPALSKPRRSASRRTRRARRLGVGIAGGDGFDGGIVGGGAGVTHGAGVFVEGLRRPYDRELGLAGLAAVGLLDLGPRWHAGAVEAEIDGGGIAGLGLDDAAFVACDLAPERLGVAFDRLGGEGEAGQFAQQGAGALEAGPGRGDANHA